jgi:Uma2 family endonuclease
MAPMTTALLTADEYIATAETRSRWTQLINGEVHVNTPSIQHQRIVGLVMAALHQWTQSQAGSGSALPTIDIRTDDGSVLAPDGLWGSTLPTSGMFLTTPPELVFEVRSPSTWKYDTGVKLQKYQSFGVHEVWLVDTESKSILVHRRSSVASPTFDVALELFVTDTLTSPLLDGFALQVTEIFPA